MGPALETLLGAIFLVLLGLGVLIYLSRPLWPRVARFFHAWQERDTALEREQQMDREHRRAAEDDIRKRLGEEDSRHPDNRDRER